MATFSSIVELSRPGGHNPLAALSLMQNDDGGWGYGGGGSWVEPTALAILAFAGDRQLRYAGAMQRGVNWLLVGRRPDGGWAPRPSVDQSTWVTGLVLLCMAARGRLAASDPAIRWLLRNSGADAGLVNRLRFWLAGAGSRSDQQNRAWPWYPGTAAWVHPTSMTILALGAVQARFPSNEIAQRIQEARQFLLSRECRRGGWDEGSSRETGYDNAAYPETTGIALLALHGISPGRLARSIEFAQHQLACTRSIQAKAWLTLGLLAHGRPVPPWNMADPCRGVLDGALCALAAHATEARNLLLTAGYGVENDHA